MVYKLVKVGMKFLVDKLLLTSFVAAVVKAIALSRYACNFKKMAWNRSTRRISEFEIYLV